MFYMKNNLYKKILFTFICVFSCVFMVKAAPSISNIKVLNDADVIEVTTNANGSAITGYSVGLTLASSIYYPNTSSTFRASVMNGNYLVWAKDAQGNYSSPATTAITNSCNNETKTNQSGQGTVERCFVYNGSTVKTVKTGELVTCKDGYELQYLNVLKDTCANLNSSSLTEYGLTQKYCKRIYNYNCIAKTSTKSSTLSGLSLSSGTLSPAFSPTTYSYSASVNVSAVTVNATLNSDGSSFVDGYGSRTVKLNYGSNSIAVKVQSSTGAVTTYTIKVTRVDNRSKGNTLNSLSVSVGLLNPSFSSSTTSYNVEVDNSVASETISATLADSSSSFVDGYGPRTVDVAEGDNEFLVKVKSQSGATKTYSIKIFRQKGAATEEPVKEEDTSEYALLKSLTLSEGNINFEEKTFEYTVYVNNDITLVTAQAEAKNKDDKVTIEGGENLEVGVENQLKVIVEDTTHGITRTYSINIIRKEEGIEVSSNSEVSNITIKDHKISFEQSTESYSIILNKDETELDIEVTPEDSKSVVSIEGNADLKMGSIITITVTAEDGTTSKYYIEITGVQKGTNVFLIVLLIIVIFVILGYIILRIMGYKIYLNLSVLNSLFSTIGEKIKNIFDR